MMELVQHGESSRHDLELISQVDSIYRKLVGLTVNNNRAEVAQCLWELKDLIACQPSYSSCNEILIRTCIGNTVIIEKYLFPLLRQPSSDNRMELAESLHFLNLMTRHIYLMSDDLIKDSGSILLKRYQQMYVHMTRYRAMIIINNGLWRIFGDRLARAISPQQSSSELLACSHSRMEARFILPILRNILMTPVDCPDYDLPLNQRIYSHNVIIHQMNESGITDHLCKITMNCELSKILNFQLYHFIQLVYHAIRGSCLFQIQSTRTLIPCFETTLQGINSMVGECFGTNWQQQDSEISRIFASNAQLNPHLEQFCNKMIESNAVTDRGIHRIAGLPPFYRGFLYKQIAWLEHFFMRFVRYRSFI